MKYLDYIATCLNTYGVTLACKSIILNAFFNFLQGITVFGPTCEPSCTSPDLQWPFVNVMILALPLCACDN